MMHLKEFGIEASIKESIEAPLRYEAQFKVPISLKYFEGHFPNNPVLPAFASVEISLALGRDLKLLPEKVKKISNAKFLAIVKPEAVVKILVKTYESSVDFEWQVEEQGQWKKACDVSVSV
jgi:3-hydroxyacyl-[acyl-carrier-protein] dehydratase